MIDQKLVREIEEIPVAERIRLMEILLTSLKRDITEKEVRQTPYRKKFTVRTFHLGDEIHVDRDSLYSERGL